MCSTDQLVCDYYNCTDDGRCVQGYEVCSENSIMSDDDRHVCVAVLYGNATNDLRVVWKGCFSDEDDFSNGTCILMEYPTNYYSCLCNATLCNSNDSLMLPPNHTRVPPSGK